MRRRSQYSAPDHSGQRRELRRAIGVTGLREQLSSRIAQRQRRQRVRGPGGRRADRPGGRGCPPAPGGAGQRGGPVKTLWVDASNGAAGDMLLAALLDAGADLDAVRTGLRGIDVEPVGLTLSAVRRHGLRAAQVVVDAPDSEATRNLPDVVSILSGPGLPRQVQDFAVAVFQRLARAEAGVHGVAPDEIGYHEVGALDAIADVAGCALALHSLGLLQPCTRVVSPVAAGSGSVRTAHGTVPVPVPAVLRMLADATAPLSAHPAAMELCTPTGAALL